MPFHCGNHQQQVPYSPDIRQCLFTAVIIAIFLARGARSSGGAVARMRVILADWVFSVMFERERERGLED